MLNTEQRNPRTTHIDKMPTAEMLAVMQEEYVNAAKAVELELPAIEAAKMIHQTKVDNLPVLNKAGKVVGIIEEKDLIEFLAMLDKK